MQCISSSKKTALNYRHLKTSRPTSLISSQSSRAITLNADQTNSQNQNQRNTAIISHCEWQPKETKRSNSITLKESLPIVISSDEEENVIDAHEDRHVREEECSARKRMVDVAPTLESFSSMITRISAMPQTILLTLLTTVDTRNQRSGLIPQHTLIDIEETTTTQQESNDENEADDESDHEKLITNVLSSVNSKNKKKPYAYWRKIFENHLERKKIINNDHYEHELKKSNILQKIQIKIKMNELETLKKTIFRTNYLKECKRRVWDMSGFNYIVNGEIGDDVYLQKEGMCKTFLKYIAESNNLSVEELCSELKNILEKVEGKKKE